MSDTWANHRGHDVIESSSQTVAYKLVDWTESTEMVGKHEETLITVILSNNDEGEILDVTYIEYVCRTCGVVMPEDMVDREFVE